MMTPEERDKLISENRVEELRRRLAEEKRNAARELERERRTLRIELELGRGGNFDAMMLVNVFERLVQRINVVKVELDARGLFSDTKTDIQDFCNRDNKERNFEGSLKQKVASPMGFDPPPLKRWWTGKEPR